MTSRRAACQPLPTRGDGLQLCGDWLQLGTATQMVKTEPPTSKAARLPASNATAAAASSAIQVLMGAGGQVAFLLSCLLSTLQVVSSAHRTEGPVRSGTTVRRSVPRGLCAPRGRAGWTRQHLLVTATTQGLPLRQCLPDAHH